LAPTSTPRVDVGAKSEIYSIIDNLAKAGTAILVISSDLPEIIGICDRVLVMRDHAIVAELSGPEIAKTTILNHCYQEVAA